jgi:hypothetical protein
LRSRDCISGVVEGKRQRAVVTQQRLAETGAPGYQPYLYQEGLFDRSWPEYRAPVEQHWQAYIEGRTSVVEALRAIAAAMRRALCQLAGRRGSKGRGVELDRGRKPGPAVRLTAARAPI